MNKIRTISVLFVLLSCVMCTKQNPPQSVSDDSKTVIISAQIPTDEIRTIENTDYNFDLKILWDKGKSKVILVFKQGNTLIMPPEPAVMTDVTGGGIFGSFKIDIPEGIDPDKPFDLYGICSSKVLVEDGKILVNIERTKFVLPDKTENNLEHIPMYFEAKQINSGYRKVKFKHLGSVGVVEVKNFTDRNVEDIDCLIKPADGSNPPFYYQNDNIYLNLLDPEAPIEERAGEAQVTPKFTLPAGRTRLFATWFRPNGQNVPPISVQLKEGITSYNSLPAREKLTIGRSYRIGASYYGTDLRINPKGPGTDLFYPYIEIKTEKALKEQLEISIDSSKQDFYSFWIDWNNNGKREQSEKFYAFPPKYEYIGVKISSQTIRIYGPVEKLTLISHHHDDGSISGQRISYIDLSHNGLLTELSCDFNELTSLDVSRNPKLTKLNCIGNKNLKCIKVSSAQLANIPADWSKDDTTSYSLECKTETAIN